jgi:hypothetical protein
MSRHSPYLYRRSRDSHLPQVTCFNPCAAQVRLASRIGSFPNANGGIRLTQGRIRAYVTAGSRSADTMRARAAAMGVR